MTILESCLAKVKKLAGDKAGNLAIISALAMPVGLAAVGSALDLASIIATKHKLQAAADAGAVAAAAYMVNDEAATIDGAKALGKSFVRGQISSELAKFESDSSSTVAEGGSGGESYDFNSCSNVDVTPIPGYGTSMTYDVEVTTCLEMQLTALNVLLGRKKETIYVTSKAESKTGSENAMSMYLVLDRSGSMDWDTNTPLEEPYEYDCSTRWKQKTCTQSYVKKIDALKSSVSDLLAVIDSADPEANYSRLASVSYNYTNQLEKDFTWGTSEVASYVNAMTANGGTDSSGAVKIAYEALADTSEDTEHFNKNKQTPDKFIVFMTDGDNNYVEADTSTTNWCNQAKAKGIEIYTVAFMAPEGGQNLLKGCATDDAHYFKADDADQMNQAFKHIGQKAVDAMARLTQ